MQLCIPGNWNQGLVRDSNLGRAHLSHIRSNNLHPWQCKAQHISFLSLSPSNTQWVNSNSKQLMTQYGTIPLAIEFSGNDLSAEARENSLQKSCSIYWIELSMPIYPFCLLHRRRDCIHRELYDNLYAFYLALLSMALCLTPSHLLVRSLSLVVCPYTRAPRSQYAVTRKTALHIGATYLSCQVVLCVFSSQSEHQYLSMAWTTSVAIAVVSIFIAISSFYSYRAEMFSIRK